jgi:hypothetical protein
VLAIDHIRHRRGIGAGTRLELPQALTRTGVVGVEVSIAFAREHSPPAVLIVPPIHI